MAQPAPEPVVDRTEEMEAEIARLLQERVEMQSSHDEAVRSLETAVTRAQEAAERSETEVRASCLFGHVQRQKQNCYEYVQVVERFQSRSSVYWYKTAANLFGGFGCAQVTAQSVAVCI